MPSWIDNSFITPNNHFLINLEINKKPKKINLIFDFYIQLNHKLGKIDFDIFIEIHKRYLVILNQIKIGYRFNNVA